MLYRLNFFFYKILYGAIISWKIHRLIVKYSYDDFKARLEELQERMEKLKKELRKQKEKESNFLGEKDKLKQV